MTEDGLLCLVPPETQIGAEVVVLFGGRVPHILRRAGDYREFEGECYVHGYMDGEGVQENGMTFEQEDVDWFVGDRSLIQDVKIFDNR